MCNKKIDESVEEDFEEERAQKEETVINSDGKTLKNH